MVVVDGQGVPLGKQLYSASPNEVRLAEETLASIQVTRSFVAVNLLKEVQTAKLSAAGPEEQVPSERTLRFARSLWKSLAIMASNRANLSVLVVKRGPVDRNRFGKVLYKDILQILLPQKVT